MEGARSQGGEALPRFQGYWVGEIRGKLRQKIQRRRRKIGEKRNYIDWPNPIITKGAERTGGKSVGNGRNLRNGKTLTMESRRMDV